MKGGLNVPRLSIDDSRLFNPTSVSSKVHTSWGSERFAFATGKCSIRSFRALGPIVKRDSLFVSGTPGAIRDVGIKRRRRWVFTTPKCSEDNMTSIEQTTFKFTYHACSAASQSVCFRGNPGPLGLLLPLLPDFLLRSTVHIVPQISQQFYVSGLTVGPRRRVNTEYLRKVTSKVFTFVISWPVTLCSSCTSSLKSLFLVWDTPNLYLEKNGLSYLNRQ